MKQLKYLIEKEFKQIRRNSILPKMIVGFPILVMLILPWAINFEVKNIRIHIVDHAKSNYSQRLINKIESSAYFILGDVSAGYRQAIDDVEQGKADIILEIPASFDKDMVRDRQANVMIAANAVNNLMGLMANNYLTQIVADFSGELRGEIYPASVMVQGPRIEVVTDYRYNKRLDYKSFMLPGFIVLMMTLLCGILPSLNIVMEKETGTIQQINATPVSKFNFILAKVIPYWIIGLIVLTISFLITWWVYGLLPSGNFLTLYFASIVFLLGITGLGIVVSNYSNTLQQSMFLIMFFILIIILLSGLFTPISSMPRWAKVIANLNPLSYFIEAMRLVYLKGSSLGDISGYLLKLAGFGLFFNAWAVISYKKRGN